MADHISSQPLADTSFLLDGDQKSPEFESGACNTGGFVAMLGQVCLCPCTFGVTCCSSFFTVDQQTEVVELRWGKYAGTHKTPGQFIWSNKIGRELRKVSTQLKNLDLARFQVIDLDGNPLIVSGVIVFQVIDTYRAAIEIENYTKFVHTQAESVLRDVIGRYPYESQDSHCLRREVRLVNDALRLELQRHVTVSGIQIHSFNLKEISYSPVIAASMLKRQQAQALIQARTAIVSGAVDIATMAARQLRERGVELSREEQSKLTVNLVTVIAAETDVTPTLNLSS